MMDNNFYFDNIENCKTNLNLPLPKDCTKLKNKEY